MTSRTASARNLTASVGATLSYYINNDTVAHVFTSYQTRDSTGAKVSDYSNIDASIGGSVSYKF